MRRLPLLMLALLSTLALLAAACGDDADTDVGDQIDTGIGTDDDQTGGEEPDDDAALDGAWILTNSLVDGAPLALLDDYPVTMNIEDGDIGGRAACNSYGGEVTIDGSQFGVGAVFQTEMGCEPAPMALEFEFLSALQRVDTWTRDGDVTELTGDGVSLSFEIVPPPPTAELVDTVWVLDTIIDGAAASSTIGGADEALLTLTAAGALTGSTGCRTFVGEYLETGGTLTVTNLAMEGECDSDFVWQDNAVVSVLEGELTIEIDGPRLTLSSPFDEGLRYTAEG